MENLPAEIVAVEKNFNLHALGKLRKRAQQFRRQFGQLLERLPFLLTPFLLEIKPDPPRNHLSLRFQKADHVGVAELVRSEGRIVEFSGPRHVLASLGFLGVVQDHTDPVPCLEPQVEYLKPGDVLEYFFSVPGRAVQQLIEPSPVRGIQKPVRHPGDIPLLPHERHGQNQILKISKGLLAFEQTGQGGEKRFKFWWNPDDFNSELPP